MLDADEATEVPAASTNVGLSPQYFDGAMKVGRGVGANGGLHESVWDAFLFYPRGAVSNDLGLPFPDRMIAQQGGVVVGSPGTLPALPDQARLPRELRGKVAVVGDQPHFEALLEQAATAFLRQP